MGKYSNPSSVISEAVSTDNLGTPTDTFGTSRVLSEESLEDLEASEAMSDNSLPSGPHSEARSLPGTLEFNLSHIPESPTRIPESHDLEPTSYDLEATSMIPPDSLDQAEETAVADESIPPDSLETNW